MVPNDPFMLLSYVNTKLRDEYGSLDELCRELDINYDILLQKLKEIDYRYDEGENRFI